MLISLQYLRLLFAEKSGAILAGRTREKVLYLHTADEIFQIPEVFFWIYTVTSRINGRSVFQKKIWPQYEERKAAWEFEWDVW